MTYLKIWLFKIRFFFMKLSAPANGRKDGKINIPDSYISKSAYLKRIHDMGSNAMNLLAGAWSARDKALKSRYIKQMFNQIDSKNRFNSASENYNNAMIEYKKHSGEETVPKDLRGRIILYRIILIAGSFADAYFFIVAFRVFGEAEIINIIFSLIVGSVIAFTCHYVGATLASREGRMSMKTKLLAPFALFFLAVALGVIRYLYLQDTTASIVFTIFTIVIFSLSIFVSYFLHKNHLHQLYNAEKRFKNSERASSYYSRRAADAITKREKGHEALISEAHRIDNLTNIISDIYWQENIRFRTSRNGFNTFEPPDIVIDRPENLPESKALLDWSLPERIKNMYLKLIEHEF